MDLLRSSFSFDLNSRSVSFSGLSEVKGRNREEPPGDSKAKIVNEEREKLIETQAPKNKIINYN
jgi:hypothetical protein